MTENTTTPFHPTTEHGSWGTPPPAPKKKQWFTKPIVWVPAAAMLLGLAIGSSNTPAPVEVVKEVPGPERIVTKTEKVDVPVTPQACLVALDINELAFTLVSESLGHVLDADYTAANASSDKVKALVPKANAAKSECRASAK